MLRNITIFLLASLFNLLFGQAYAAEPTTFNLTFAAPSDAARGAYYNPAHFAVVVYKDSPTCPLQMETTVVPDGRTLYVGMKIMKFSEIRPETAVPLEIGHTYSVGSYHRSGRGADGMAIGTYTPDSCRTFTVTADPSSVQPYAPLVGSWRANGELLDTTVSIKLPQTVPGIFLISGRGPECEPNFQTSGSPGRPLNGSSHDIIEIFKGGTWHIGMYEEYEPMVVTPASQQAGTKHYRVLRGTCQTVVVNDFDAKAEYTPDLPRRVLAPLPVPELTAATVAKVENDHSVDREWSLGMGGAGTFEGTGSSGGVAFRGGLVQSHLALSASLMLDFVPIPPEAVSARARFGVGAGYGNHHALPRPIMALPETFGWEALLAGGLGSFQAECGPEEFSLNATAVSVTCGHEEGFPLRLVGPWFGPELSGRLLWPTKTKNGRPYSLGLNLSFAGEIYLVSNTWPLYTELEGRSATIHTTEGDREVAYSFQHDWMGWFVPAVDVGIVFVW